MEDVALHDEDEQLSAAEEPVDDAEATARKTKGSGYIEQDNL